MATESSPPHDCLTEGDLGWIGDRLTCATCGCWFPANEIVDFVGPLCSSAEAPLPAKPNPLLVVLAAGAWAAYVQTAVAIAEEIANTPH